MSVPDTLKQDLAWIRRHFDVKELLASRITERDIQRYYTQSSIAYRLAHSFDGAVHMALSQDGRFHFSDYDAHIRQLKEHIPSYDMRVLELGCGRGYNIKKLAAAQPDNQFHGIDLTPLHVMQASDALIKQRNAAVVVADFHRLPYRFFAFDYVYAIESVCHSNDVQRVLEEAYNTLKLGGRFILFDGFRIVPTEELTDDQHLARRLIDKSMGIQEASFIDPFVSAAQEAGFVVEECRDLAAQILPNLKRLRDLALFWRYAPMAVQAAQVMLPKLLVQNIIAALLMPYMVDRGFQGYYLIVLEKSA